MITGVRRRLSAAAVLAMLCLAVQAPALAAIPEGGLDFGIEGLPIPDPLQVNETSPRTATLLAGAMKDEKVPFRRVRLVQDLGSSRVAEAVPAVVSALEDGDAAVRVTAAEAIAVLGAEDPRSQASRAKLLGNADVTGRLKKLVADPDPAVRGAALRALAVVNPSDNAIAAALGSADEALLSAGIDAARSSGEGEVLLGRLGTVPVALQPRALLAIGRTKPAGAAKQLAQLASPDLPIPQLAPACQALGMLASGEAMQRLSELLGHKHSVIRREAMLAIGPCAKPEEARRLGVQMLSDTDATVRQAAATVLGRCLAAEIVPSLLPQLADRYKPAWKAARDALAQAPSGAAREAVIQAAGELLENPDPRRREDGSYLLGHFRSDHRFERHLQLMSDEDPELAAQVAESLGLIGRQEARAEIVKLGQVADTPAAGKKQMAAAKALVAGGRLGASELLPTCQRILASDPRFSFHTARSASAFVIGVTAEADSPIVEALYGPLKSQMEGVPVKFEAVKAMGNLRYRKAAGQLAVFPTSKTPQMQWILQWYTARITGEPEQHPPTPSPWVAETSIRDMADRER